LFFYFNFTGADPPHVVKMSLTQLWPLQVVLLHTVNRLMRRINGQKTVCCEVRSLFFYFNLSGADPPPIVLVVSGSIMATSGGILVDSKLFNTPN